MWHRNCYHHSISSAKVHEETRTSQQNYQTVHGEIDLENAVYIHAHFGHEKITCHAFATGTRPRRNTSLVHQHNKRVERIQILYTVAPKTSLQCPALQQWSHPTPKHYCENKSAPKSNGFSPKPSYATPKPQTPDSHPVESPPEDPSPSASKDHYTEEPQIWNGITIGKLCNGELSRLLRRCCMLVFDGKSKGRLSGKEVEGLYESYWSV